MFLTTNQIAQFDVAIPSRIHISIQYASLKPVQMEEIFKGFLQPLEDKNLVDDYDGILECEGCCTVAHAERHVGPDDAL